MALMLISQPSTTDQKPRSSFRSTSIDKKSTTFQLKDYLQDDFGSCSSSGFRSFPRRQCCAAAARSFTLDSSSRSSSSKRFMRKMNRSKSTSSKLTSALQRASIAVMNAVKFIPFRSSSSSNSNSSPVTNMTTTTNSMKRKKVKSNVTIMPRSLSRRLFSSRSFWRRSNSNLNLNSDSHHEISIHHSTRSVSGGGDDERCEIEKWISSGMIGSGNCVPTSSDLSNSTTTTTLSVTTMTTVTTTSSSDDSWSESDSVFALVTGTSHIVDKAAQSRSTVEINFAGREEKNVVDTATMTKTQENNWANVDEHEKEQQSPISVLDFPDYYCYDEAQSANSTSSPFSPTRRFGCLSNLHPVNLESMLSLTADSDDSESDQAIEDDDDDDVNYASSLTADQERLLERIIKDKNSPMSLAKRCGFANLLLDFFEEGMERVMSGGGSMIKVGVEEVLLKEAEDWMKGISGGKNEENELLGCKDEEKRAVYVQGTEQGGDWRRCVDANRDEVVVELESQMLALLVDELMVELFV